MVNVSRLRKGDRVKVVEDIDCHDVKIGDKLKVVGTGRSRWDRADYADCITKEGYPVEIMHDGQKFELIK
jgi:hypothetical protein